MVAGSEAEMRVSIFDGSGTVIWERDTERHSGSTSLGYLTDGTQKKIASALSQALAEAEGELLLGRVLQVADVVPDVGATPAQIDGDVPVAGAGNNNPRRKHLVMASEVLKPTTAPVALKVGVIRKHDVALMVAVNDDHVALF